MAADFNGDGKLDVATADNSDSFVTIMLQSPPVQFSPLSLDFSVVPEGATSPEQPLTITNMGGTTANISSLTVSAPFQFDVWPGDDLFSSFRSFHPRPLCVLRCRSEICPHLYRPGSRYRNPADQHWGCGECQSHRHGCCYHP